MTARAPPGGSAEAGAAANKVLTASARQPAFQPRLRLDDGESAPGGSAEAGEAATLATIVHKRAHALGFIVSICCLLIAGGGLCSTLSSRAGPASKARPAQALVSKRFRVNFRRTLVFCWCVSGPK